LAGLPEKAFCAQVKVTVTCAAEPMGPGWVLEEIVTDVGIFKVVAATVQGDELAACAFGARPSAHSNMARQPSAKAGERRRAFMRVPQWTRR
jgi:hypothetical protein